MHDFEAAKDKVLMGVERRSMVMSEDEKRLTAYHEAGHSLVGLHVPKHDPLHKVTIIPRGRALGLTMSLPERDRHSYSKLELESKLAVLFGGRIAEELVFGADNVTTGAGNDIRQATEMARRMVTEFGFQRQAGAAPLQRQSGRDLPRALGHAAEARLRRHGAPDRRGGAAPDRRGGSDRPTSFSTSVAGIWMCWPTRSWNTRPCRARRFRRCSGASRSYAPIRVRNRKIRAVARRCPWAEKSGKEQPRGGFEAEPQPNS